MATVRTLSEGFSTLGADAGIKWRLNLGRSGGDLQGEVVAQVIED
jgi:hypothetical protein